MNIFVRNLASSLTAEQLTAVFSPFGQVDTIAINPDPFADSRTARQGGGMGKSRGYGYVNMPNMEEAVAAIQGLQGTEIMGYPLNLVEALPKQK